MRLLISLKAAIKVLLCLYQSKAPVSVYASYFATIFERLRCHKHRAAQAQFDVEVQSLKLSHHWFKLHVPFWLERFADFQMTNRPIKAMEIGCWEGLSSYFTLKNLPMAQLTSVDTWEGSDEHQGTEFLITIEQKFDFNTSAFKDRLTKFKGTSYSFFNTNPEPESFDMIYVDGSHHADDVMIDVIKSFQLLKKGGLMIFDDYVWKFYPRVNDNPAAAINAFLKLKKGQFKLLHVYAQLMIQKI